jgi:hypothetical protein
MIGDLIGDLLGQALFEAVFYVVGRVAIPVVSMGRWRCLPLLSHAKGRGWGGLIHRNENRHILHFWRDSGSRRACLSVAGDSSRVLLVFLCNHNW